MKQILAVGKVVKGEVVTRTEFLNNPEKKAVLLEGGDGYQFVCSTGVWMSPTIHVLFNGKKLGTVSLRSDATWNELLVRAESVAACYTAGPLVVGASSDGAA